MPQTRSQNKSKRQQTEETAARIRAALGINPDSLVKKVVVAPKDRLEEAWKLASTITEFATTYLRHFMIDPVTEEFIPPADFHLEIYKILLTEQFAAIAAPREHAKSTVVSVIFPLYCICYKLRKFIVLISDTQPQAALQLAAIKEELETNAELIETFGDLVGTKKWDVNDCRTSTGITLAARGAGQSLRGLRYRQYRPDLVIIDDIENEEGVENPETRAKLVRWFKGTVMNLGKYCQIFVVGTILHFDSFLSDLLDPKKFKRFVKRRLMAVDTEWTPSSVLWPAKWDIGTLKAKEEDLGTVFFNQEFRNLPISEETQVFKDEWIQKHGFHKRDELGTIATVISYVDPAISQKKKSDYFASVTIGIETTGKIRVLRTEQDKMPFTRQVAFILQRYDEEKPDILGIEAIAYQEALKQTLDEVSVETGRYINVVAVVNSSDKFMRIATLSSLVENGTLSFCLDGSQATVINQLLFLGKMKDDLADALQGAVALARNFNAKAAIATGDAQIGMRDSGGRGLMTRLVGKRMEEDSEDEAQEFAGRDRRSRWG